MNCRGRRGRKKELKIIDKEKMGRGSVQIRFVNWRSRRGKVVWRMMRWYRRRGEWVNVT